MATKSDFTAEEWATLQAGVVGGPTLVSVAQGGFWDSFKEAGAISKAMANAIQSADNLLVRDLANIRGFKNPYKATSSPIELSNEVVADLGKAVAIIEAKDPADLDAYRAFVLELAGDVANAAGGTSDTEQQMIDAITNALNSKQ